MINYIYKTYDDFTVLYDAIDVTYDGFYVEVTVEVGGPGSKARRRKRTRRGKTYEVVTEFQIIGLKKLKIAKNYNLFSKIKIIVDKIQGLNSKIKLSIAKLLNPIICKKIINLEQRNYLIGKKIDNLEINTKIVGSKRENISFTLLSESKVQFNVNRYLSVIFPASYCEDSRFIVAKKMFNSANQINIEAKKDIKSILVALELL